MDEWLMQGSFVDQCSDSRCKHPSQHSRKCMNIMLFMGAEEGNVAGLDNGHVALCCTNRRKKNYRMLLYLVAHTGLAITYYTQPVLITAYET